VGLGDKAITPINFYRQKAAVIRRSDDPDFLTFRQFYLHPRMPLMVEYLRIIVLDSDIARGF